MNQRKRAYWIGGLCTLLAAAVLAYCLTDGFRFGDVNRTSLTFSPAGGGFLEDMRLYTEDGITSIDFTGEITVAGTADILLHSDGDGAQVYRETYTDVTGKPLRFTIEDLTPYAYYTLSFSGEEAASGHLFLTTDQSLAKRPLTPFHPPRPVPAAAT